MTYEGILVHLLPDVFDLEIDLRWGMNIGTYHQILASLLVLARATNTICLRGGVMLGFEGLIVILIG